MIRKPKEHLEATGCRSTEDRVSIVDRADLTAIPADAHSLRRWIDRARIALAPHHP